MSELIAQGWVNTREAADITGHSVAYIRQMIRRERIEAHKVGRDWLVNLSSLLAYKRQMETLGNDKHNPWREDLAASGRGRME